jgi:hypothetical protein
MASMSEGFELPDGGVLRIREGRSADSDLLVALYASLDEEDTYRRFFSGYRPPRAVIDHWASIGDEGGCLLLATVERDGRTVVVGEAGYALLRDGTGDFGITVAPGNRGWLGPVLLDRLVEHAAARGVMGLVADVLIGNRAMLSLVRARGCVTVGRPDVGITRVLLGTSGRIPPWPNRDGPRVLVEGGRGAWFNGGYPRDWRVICCPGPDGIRCPAVTQRACPLAAGADVVVLDVPGGGSRDALMDAHRRLHPRTRLIADPESVVDAVQRALGDRSVT